MQAVLWHLSCNSCSFQKLLPTIMSQSSGQMANWSDYLTCQNTLRLPGFLSIKDTCYRALSLCRISHCPKPFQTPVSLPFPQLLILLETNHFSHFICLVLCSWLLVLFLSLFSRAVLISLLPQPSLWSVLLAMSIPLLSLPLLYSSKCLHLNSPLYLQ